MCNEYNVGMNANQTHPQMKSFAVRVSFETAPHTSEAHTVTVVAHTKAEARAEVKWNFSRHFQHVKIMHVEVK